MSLIVHLIGGEMHGSAINVEEKNLGCGLRIAEPMSTNDMPRVMHMDSGSAVFRYSTYHYVKSVWNPALGRDEYIAVHEAWLR
jgi:hypothetical protein